MKNHFSTGYGLTNFTYQLPVITKMQSVAAPSWDWLTRALEALQMLTYGSFLLTSH